MPSAVETPEVKLGGPNGGGPRDHGPYDRGGGGGDDHGNDGRGVPGAGLLAMRFLLVSISMLFVTIGVAYYERARSPAHWQHIHVPPLLWLSTGLILGQHLDARNRARGLRAQEQPAVCALAGGDGRRWERRFWRRSCSRCGSWPGKDIYLQEQSAQLAVLRADGRARPAPAGRHGRAGLPAGDRGPAA